MNILKTLTTAYCALRPRAYIPDRLLSPLRFLLRLLTDSYFNIVRTRICFSNTNSVNSNIVVSLTSFPARIDNLWKVIASLKNQDVRPKKIILWLSLEQFNAKNELPKTLLDCEDELFDICMVEGDLRSHKKYYYAMNKYPGTTIVTVDDDIIYHPHTLSYLVEASNIYDNAIITNIGSKIKYTEGNICPYKEWNNVSREYENNNVVQIGAGGVLYPPCSLASMCLDESLFMKYAPMADDLWLNAMARIKKTQVVKSASHILPMPVCSKTPSLYDENVGGGKNDKQLKSIREYLINKLGVDVYDENYYG